MSDQQPKVIVDKRELNSPVAKAHKVECLSEFVRAVADGKRVEWRPDKKSSLATEGDNPVADSLIAFQSISKYATEGN